MSQDRSPAAGPGAQDTAPWLVLGVIAAGLLAFAAVWAGGTLGVAAAGGGWDPPPFTFATAAALVRGGPGRVWPGHGSAAGAGTAVLGVLAAAAAVAAWWAWRRKRPARAGLAGRRDLAPMAPRAVAARARQLRPSLAGRSRIDPDQTGVLIGEVDGPGSQQVRFSFEDTFIAFMAPRSGKTTALTVPAILSAPGPVLATSNKHDVYTATVSARTDGQVWRFDPQNILHLPRQCWWDMISSAATIEGSIRLSGHFITTALDAHSRGDFFAKSARRLLTTLFHAAALTGAQVDDVLSWLATPGDRAPVDALRRHNLVALSRSLDQTGKLVAETRDGIYETAQHAVTCLFDPAVTAWVTPDHTVPQFDPHAFVTSRDTLYLLSKDGGGGAAAVIAAAADAVLQAGMAAGELTGGGRLDPPLLAVLDEAANICRIEDLPDLYSHLGSRGVIPMSILQSWPQGLQVWGEHPFEALWSASTVKLIGAGIDDADFAERVSRLIGEHDVYDTSVSRGSTGHSLTTSRRRERVMDAGAVRALPRGSALLLATGLPVGRIRLLPWYDGPQAGALDDARRTVEAQITQRARQERRPGGAR